jgi:tRNA nucleotidyltransferase (CCA-adding enzyme)
MSVKRKADQLAGAAPPRWTSPPRPPPFDLTESERALFAAIRACCAVHAPDLVVRAAGGWVRDKLMRRHSSDIDFALDTMSGAQFADMFVNKHLASCSPAQMSGIGVIRKNPQQSKHLETACFHVFGMSIDCCGLRTDVYTDQSTRIPEIRLGTPEEDANRRDFTINSLFFNLRTCEIEDFTSRGLQDLAEGLIRTPIDPVQTFLDDPLRVLRAVRFAGRFRFRVDPALVDAASSSTVHVCFLI